MNPFALLMFLYQTYMILHGQLTSGTLSQMHGQVYLVARQTPPGADEILISTVTL